MSEITEYTNLIKIIRFKEIVNLEESTSILNDFFIFDKELFLEKIQNINYSAFNSIQTKEDLSQVSIFTILNFFVDNRYDLQNVIRMKQNKSFSEVPFKKLIKIKNYKQWFNYFGLVSLITGVLS